MTQIELGELIRKAREKKNINQMELAKKLGYGSPQFISLMERGLSKTPPDKLKVLCGALDLDLEKIIKGLVKQSEIELRSQVYGKEKV